MLNYDTLSQLAEVAVNLEDWTITTAIGKERTQKILIDIITQISESKALTWHITTYFINATIIVCQDKISIIEENSLGKFNFSPKLMENIDPDDENQVGMHMIEILYYLDTAVERLICD